MRMLLAPFALLYGLVILVRNTLFSIGIFPSATYGFPIIGVGNLRVGGTGKSPMIEHLIRHLSAKYRLGVLSRGYGRYTSGFIIADQDSTARTIGDEPRQFKQKFPDTMVAVDTSRKRGLEKMKLEEPNLQIALLDDNMQHRWVKPGLQIMLTAFGDEFYNDHLLPMGRLREFRSGYKRADIIVVTKVPTQLTKLERRAIRDEIAPLPYQHVLFSSVKYAELQHVFKNEHRGFGYLSKLDTAVLVTGIADPSDFESFIEERVSVSSHLKFGDHHKFSPSDIKKIQHAWKNTKSEHAAIITTEKDAQRLVAFFEDESFRSLPIYFLRIEIVFQGDDEQTLNQLINEYVRGYPTIG